MNDFERTELPDDLADVGARLHESRYQPTPLELDELKRRSLSRAAARERAPQRGLRGRLATVFLVAAMTIGFGTAGVLAGSYSSKQAPSASLSQYEGEVLPEVILPGSARFSGPSKCVKRPFVARVRGQNIARIVFRLDGRRIKTINVRSTSEAVRTYRVRVNGLTLGAGVHRLTARVEFRAETKKSPRTLRLIAVRCSRGTVRPRFTG